jgi:hypothetical protein
LNNSKQPAKVSKQRLALHQPVIIGGIGGSGTRVLALLLEQMGVYMGDYNSRDRDSGFFGKLIARYPQFWKAKNETLSKWIVIFSKLHLGKALSIGELYFLFARIARWRLSEFYLLVRRAYTLPNPRRFALWGFKHACSLFYLSQLAYALPGSRYIHVIRHGLDMGSCPKDYQILNWGKDFGVDVIPGSITESQRVDYWIEVNKWALAQCQNYFPGRHHVVYFDRLCSHTEEEIVKLVDFLGIEPELSIAELASFVNSPPSIGRYKAHINKFNPLQIEAVKDFGFVVE